MARSSVIQQLRRLSECLHAAFPDTVFCAQVVPTELTELFWSDGPSEASVEEALWACRDAGVDVIDVGCFRYEGVCFDDSPDRITSKR